MIGEGILSGGGAGREKDELQRFLLLPGMTQNFHFGFSTIHRKGSSPVAKRLLGIIKVHTAWNSARFILVLFQRGGGVVVLDS